MCNSLNVESPSEKSLRGAFKYYKGKYQGSILKLSLDKLSIEASNVGD